MYLICEEIVCFEQKKYLNCCRKKFNFGLIIARDFRLN